jgi:hypothetical protein
MRSLNVPLGDRALTFFGTVLQMLKKQIGYGLFIAAMVCLAVAWNLKKQDEVPEDDF